MSGTEPDIEGLKRWLGEQIGLTFAPGRLADAQRKIHRAMMRAGVPDPVAYGELIRSDNAALDDLIAELTIGETYFFREPGQFQLLRTLVLPELRRRLGYDHILRAWSAACSSGEEAYSLAIVLIEEGLAGRSFLLATDISREALSKARRGSYTKWSLRDEAAHAALPYLRRDDNRYVVDEAVRRRVAFAPLNLARDDYPSVATRTQQMDLILCRNTLIYFERKVIAAVARRLYACLAEGGWLVTASTDPPLADLVPFEMVVTDQGVLYRRGLTSAGIAPAALAGVLVVSPADIPAPPRIPDAPAPATRPPPAADLPVWEAVRSRAVPAGPPVPGPALLVESRLARPGPVVADPLPLARDDLAQGRYALAAQRTAELTDDPAACAVHVRALANLDDLAGAARVCGRAAGKHPLCPELHYLRAVLLSLLGCDEEAALEARRVTYLDRSLAIAHFTLGSILRKLGDLAGAWRAFRNAHDLCAARPADEPVPLSDGESSGGLAEAARVQMAQLADLAERRP